MNTLILGTGNLLLSDEGFGVHFIRRLEQHYRFPEEVALLDGGTMGLMLAHEIEQAERVYIVDALIPPEPPEKTTPPLSSLVPGCCVRYAKEDFMLKRIPLKLSPHQAGVQEMLLVSELRGRCPKEVFLLGVIPESLAPGCTLSPRLEQRLGPMADDLVAELRGLGFHVTGRPA
ncbi:MAG: HyaD/HybD family hydrogenase maturation endopeptidase [Limisphaerales bacterium]